MGEGAPPGLLAAGPSLGGGSPQAGWQAGRRRSAPAPPQAGCPLCKLPAAARAGLPPDSRVGERRHRPGKVPGSLVGWDSVEDLANPAEMRR